MGSGRIVAVVAALILLPSLARAQPHREQGKNPDQLGICYVFEKDQIKKTAPCVLGSGNDAHGNFFTVMHNIADGPVRIEDNLGKNGPRLITLNGEQAEVFSRDVSGRELTRDESYNATPEEHENFLTCFRAGNAAISYCFKRSQM